MAVDSVDFYRKAPPDRGASSFVYPPTPANIEFFARALQAGCVVAIPTETVYGLAAMALDTKACRAIFEIKGRPLVDPLIVHVAEPGWVGNLAEVPAELNLLAEAFWPGPLTVILRKKPVVPGLVTAGRPTVAVRMPRHPVAQALLRELGQPLAAPSANPFGYVSPSRAEHVADSFGDKVPFVLDGGPCEIGLESTILDLSVPSQPTILRPGAIAADEVTAVLNTPVHQQNLKLKLNPNLNLTQSAPAPGTFSRHYSPSSQVILFPQGGEPTAKHGEAILFLQRPDTLPSADCFWLSEDGNPATMARALFALLRKLDQAGFPRIHAEIPHEGCEGILTALRDRLNRAASRH
jgi:L-threonylcarbamoyladenylate synthase